MFTTVRREIALLVLLIGCTLALYVRTITFQFVNFDDTEYIASNPIVQKGLTSASVRWAFTTLYYANWHPLTWLSYMLDVEVAGRASPRVAHATNVALHTANAALLFLLLRGMTQSVWRSALVAALFALHPLHVESVAWVSERKDVLSTFFGLLAMIAYVRFARDGSGWSYTLVVLGFALSLMAKPMLVTLPVLLLLLDFWPLRRQAPIARLIAEKVPLLALSLASCAVTVVAQHGGGAMATLQKLGLPVRLSNAVISYFSYIVDMFWPMNLAVLYPLRQEQSLALLLLSTTTLIAITVFAVRAAKRNPALLVGWLWFLGTLVPVIGLVTVGEQARADRYTYFPLIGLFVMIAFGIPDLRGTAARSAVAAAVVSLVALTAISWRQIGVWRDSERLFAHALSVVGPHPTIYLNYGLALLPRADQRARATEYFKASLQLRPNFGPALNNLASLLADDGKLEEAAAAYRQLIEIDPRNATAQYNLGTTLAELGHFAEAEQFFRESIRLNPHFTAAQENLARTLQIQGKPTDGAAP